MAYRKTARVDEQMAERRARILKAARDLILQDKFRDASIASIADRAGVATGTVYGYFDSKVELLGEVIGGVSQRELDVVSDIVSKQAPTKEKLDLAVRAFVDRAVRGGRLAYLLIAEPIDKGVAAARLNYRKELAKVFARLIAQGVVLGELPRQTSSITAAALVGILIECLTEALSGSRTMKKSDHAGFVDEVATLCHCAVFRLKSP
ncbi:TetR/AcrR family transcriptional regulator [Bradyrhizobium diazoefficiens]|nr:TetR/AcrR family transcriptional regulator [Bradyrhizobium diazoefficiens]MBR0775354.1 TetR/AcrR family transcriptional regulator [Bradyrhizobium diazoefficiens]